MGKKAPFNAKRYYKYFKPYVSKLIAALVLLLITTLSGLIPAWIIKSVLDNFATQGREAILLYAAIGIIIFALAEGISAFGQQYLSEYVAQKIVFDLRSDLFVHLNQLSFSYYDQAQIGDLMSRVVTDTATVKRFIGFGLIRIFINITTILGIMVILLIWNLKLGLIYVAFLPFFLHAMTKYSRQVRPAHRRVSQRNGKLLSYLQEFLQGIKTIKIFGNEQSNIKKFQKENDLFYTENMKTVKITALWMPYVNFLIGVSSFVFLLFGGYLVINQEMTVGVLIGGMTYLGMLLRPIRQTGMILNAYNQALASLGRISEIFEIDSEVRERKGATSLKEVKGKIEFKDVAFAYNQKKPVLKNIDLKIEPGEKIAIVGKSGTGKTTLVNLIPRFYELDRGKILLDDHDIKEYTLSSLRKKIGFVMQKNFLFDGTILDNITYGCGYVNKDKAKRAAQIAQIDQFIETLPLKYNTPIGERGVLLSGGQAQRIALARVMITNPKVLILDEPTANLDAKTDEMVIKAIEEVTAGRTTLIIAHRLWTIRNANRVLVLNEGQVVGFASHDDLLRDNSYYQALFADQYASEEEQKGTE